MNELRAFHNDPAVKRKYLSRVVAHAKADRLKQGIGWEHGKGCAIGCTLEAYDHSRYPTELGLPEWLARLEDAIFEGLPRADAMKWPAQFLRAIKPGVDVEPVRHRLAIRRMDRLIELQTAALAHKYGYGVQEAIGKVIAALRKVRQYHVDALDGKAAAASAAYSAASAAASAAYSAAYSAADSAYSAAYSARSAAASAAASAADSADSAAASAYSAAASAAWRQEASDLLQLLRECKP